MRFLGLFLRVCCQSPEFIDFILFILYKEFYRKKHTQHTLLNYVEEKRAIA